MRLTMLLGAVTFLVAGCATGGPSSAPRAPAHLDEVPIYGSVTTTAGTQSAPTDPCDKFVHEYEACVVLPIDGSDRAALTDVRKQWTQGFADSADYTGFCKWAVAEGQAGAFGDKCEW